MKYFKTKTLYLLTLVCFMLVSLNAGVQAQTPTYNYAFDDSITITSFDGTTIAANVFVPVGNNPDEVFPAIIFPNSWGLDEYEYIVQAARLAEKGYIVFSYSARGWGQSGGMVNVAGPNDMGDLSANIDWVIANTPVDANNIGMAGISYGAGISLLGAAHDTRIKTVVAMSGWSDVGEALYAAETPRLVWGGILVMSGELLAEMDPIIAEKYANLLTHTDIEETLLWASERSPITYIDALNAQQVPIFINQNFGDELFQPNPLIKFYSQLTYPHKKMDLNLGIHATGEAGGLFGLPNAVWDNAHDWFDYWLKNIDTGIMDGDPVSMRVKNIEHRQHFEDWPSNLVDSQTFYLKRRTLFSNGGLTTSPHNSYSTNYISTGVLSGATTGVPVISPFFEAHTPLDVITWVPAINRLIAIVYESSSLSEAMLITGMPSLDLWIEPNNAKTQLIAHLYDMDSAGFGTLITHGPVTLYNAVPGQPTKVSIEFVATAYEVPQGHKIVLAIDTYDPQYGAPTLLPYSVDFLYDSNHTSELHIPYVN